MSCCRSNFDMLKTLGAGVLMATAAIGGSHLVAATQAGARYGWGLVVLILLVNLLKYPFFRAGVSYTMTSGQTLQSGYYDMGKPYLGLAFILNCISSVVNTAALTMFSACLLSLFLPVKVDLIILSGAIIGSCLFIIVVGHYVVLNRIAKLIMIILSVTTVVAALVAWSNGSVAPNGFESPSPWTLVAIGFLVKTMGWMPMPIELSSITSLWLTRQCEDQDVTLRSALFDFNLSYVVTVILALVFLALGALVLHGSGCELAAGGIGFSKQLVDIYAETIGEWSRYLIALVAFLCIFGSDLTVIDGYARALSEGWQLLAKNRKGELCERNVLFWTIAVAMVSFVILLFFKSVLMAMLGFAMTLAFMTTPMFALLNSLLLKKSNMPESLKPKLWLVVLEYLGLIYLFGFLAVFIWWKWVL